MTDGPPELARKVRRAAFVGGLGLAVQLGAAFHWTPATFILSASVGAPLVLAGGVMFLAAVLKNIRDKGAL
jgi:hypothetical protein